MPRRSFKTVSEELLETAEKAAEYLSEHGYSIRVEKSELGFPYTPTMLCNRQSTTLIVEIYASIKYERLNDWVAYGKSTGRDTRVILVLPDTVTIDNQIETKIREFGIGLWVIGASDVVERITAQDLALAVKLPELRSLPREVRCVLGSAYEQFNKALWREGFETACQAFEAEARRYLKNGINTGRIRIIFKSGKKPTVSIIDRMTMGQLGDMFAQIQNQNRADSIIGQTLKSVNKDRIGVAHHKGRKRTESRLRVNVGRHMWSLISAMKELV